MHPLQTVTLAQGSIDYLDQGEGQPMLFVHGLLVDHQIWRPLLPELSTTQRCIMPNWPLGAHAVVMKPDADLSVSGMVQLIEDFMAVLDLRDVILVGNDSGGALVQMVCARFPQRIARVVLTTCDAYDVFPPRAFIHLKWMGHVPCLAWLSYQLMQHIPPLRRLPLAFGALTDRPLDPCLIEQWLQPLRQSAGVRHDVRQFLRTLSTRDTEQAGKALQTFDKPVMLLWSTRCKYFPRRLPERMRRELRQIELHWIDSKGVFLSLEYPDWVAAHIRRFAAEGVKAPVLPRGPQGLNQG